MKNKSLRIGIACYPTYGGSGVLATELGIALAEEGHEIHFLSYESPIRLTGFHGNVRYHQVSVQEYPLFKYPPYALALATKMAEVCELHQLDLIHVHYAVPHLVSALLAREMLGRGNVKIAATLHGTDITIVGNDPSYKRATRYAIDKADGVTAVSQYLKNETAKIIGSSRHVEVVPNFVDFKRFDVTPCPDAASLRQGQEKLLIHVSNFRPVKRVADVVTSFHILSKQLEARLLMVGDGPDRSVAELQARQLGISDRVHFLGSQDALEKLLPCADLFVLPSRYESFGLAALEAMACGVPVLATNSGGLPEVIDDGANGRLVPVGDVETMAEAAFWILGDKERHATMAAAAREKAKASFTLEKILPRYEAFYRRILSADENEPS